jgi:hypothetical protein
MSLSPIEMSQIHPMLALALPAPPDWIDRAAVKLVSKLFPTDQNRKRKKPHQKAKSWVAAP